MIKSEGEKDHNKFLLKKDHNKFLLKKDLLDIFGSEYKEEIIGMVEHEFFPNSIELEDIEKKIMFIDDEKVLNNLLYRLKYSNYYDSSKMHEQMPSNMLLISLIRERQTQLSIFGKHIKTLDVCDFEGLTRLVKDDSNLRMRYYLKGVIEDYILTYSERISLPPNKILSARHKKNIINKFSKLSEGSKYMIDLLVSSEDWKDKSNDFVLALFPEHAGQIMLNMINSKEKIFTTEVI